MLGRSRRGSRSIFHEASSAVELTALEGARVVFGDVTDPKSIAAAAFDRHADVAVCCLASRTGVLALLFCVWGLVCVLRVACVCR